MTYPVVNYLQHRQPGTRYLVIPLFIEHCMTNRRDFIKAASLTGAGMFFSPLLFRSAATSNPMTGPLRFRQVHLDFHTSGLIKDVAKGFDAEKFAATLKKASVNSVTCFARCHHGYLYYDSKVHPERIHPHLTNKNL